MNKTVDQKISAASRLRGIASLLGLSLCLSSCLPAPEAPQPFPDLVFYQGAKRFSFGSEPERWLTDVPDGHGGRAKILSIEDDFYTGRGFLLYICSLEGQPGAHFLYEYDYGRADSELICELSPRRDPRFFDLDNDYSPGFFVMGDDGDSDYAFLGEGGEVVSWEGEDYPHYACKWGYASSLRAPWNDAEFGVGRRDEHNTFHFFDGTEVRVGNGGRVVSAGEDKVLILGSDYDGRLSQYDKTTGKMTRFEGDYSYPWSVGPDRLVVSTSHYARPSYIWRHDYIANIVTIVSLSEGNFVEHSFSYSPLHLGGFDRCEWIVHTDIMLVSGSNAQRDHRLRIDLKQNSIEEITSHGSARRVSFASFDHVLLKTDHYELIEMYQPTNGAAWYRNRAAYYVRDIETETITLVQRMTSSLLSFQRFSINATDITKPRRTGVC